MTDKPECHTAEEMLAAYELCDRIMTMLKGHSRKIAGGALSQAVSSFWAEAGLELQAPPVAAVAMAYAFGHRAAQDAGLLLEEHYERAAREPGDPPQTVN